MTPSLFLRVLSERASRRKDEWRALQQIAGLVGGDDDIRMKVS